MNPDRPDMLTDLTRWNRAGLKKIAYVNGDASVWLEELRLALFGLYLRGKPIDARIPERWRDLFLRPEEDWPSAADLEAAAQAVGWARLAPARPPRPESPGQRNLRLLTQYGATQNGDQAWEIARAFARAAHVHLGHVDAFANEGYLRTATQWDNLRRLAAMLNYQPGPPASATTVVALAMKPLGGVIEVAKGLAMKHTPLTGGAPLVFETLSPVTTHPDLNAARVAGWDVNGRALATTGTLTFLPGPKTALAPGDLTVLSYGPTGQTGQALALSNVTPTVTASGQARLGIVFAAPLSAVVKTAEAQLWVKPETVLTGQPAPAVGKVVVDLATPIPAIKGDVVLLITTGVPRVVTQALVTDVQGTALVLATTAALTSAVEVAAMVPLATDLQGYVAVDPAIGLVYFAGPAGVLSLNTTLPATFDKETAKSDARTLYAKPKGGNRFERGFTSTATTGVAGKLRPAAPVIQPGQVGNPTHSASFAGKPPKSLALGAWFVARNIGNGAILPLRVAAISATVGQYHLLFHSAIGSAPDQTEFHGPLTEALRPLHHDRNPDLLSPTGPTVLTAMTPEAPLLLKPGHRAILHRQTPEGVVGDVLATITSARYIEPDTAEITYALPAPTGALDDPALWAIGDTSLLLNTVTVGHGEAKGGRLLGSGDAERPEQSFRLQVKLVSHIPSTAAESGVVPDIDVAVDGTVWPWRDYIDVTAEGAKAWSSTLTEDGEVMIRFRRRLPTGTNIVTVLRHRVGTGAAGSGIPPLSFTKPQKKHPYVDAITQPFPTSGGADREAVESLRASAPSRLAANGRAVSLDDFQRLATGLSSVWRARAFEQPGSGIMRVIRLTVVPANGAALTDALKDILRPAILSKAIPGVRLSFHPFQPLPLHINAEVRADLTSFDATDVEAAAEAALIRSLGLVNRDFGQPFHVAEALAALEAVPEVETAVITSLGLGPDYDLTQPKPSGFLKPWPANVAIRDNAVVAIFPGADQVAFVPEPGNGVAQTVSVTVRGI